MELAEQLKSKTQAELEGWFSDALTAEPMPLDDLFAVLSSFCGSGSSDAAAACADLLGQVLVERGDKAGTLRLLDLLGAWKPDGPETRAACRDLALAVFKDPLGKALVANAGFDKEVPCAECVRRFGVLTKMNAGTLCRDKTWGFGAVREVDSFYQRVTVDFDKKPGHRMSLGYAAEGLELVGDGHIMARRRNAPDDIARLVREQPAEIVRLALMSYGPLSAPQIKELLVADFLPEDDWKRFWDEARAELKRDPLIEIPAKRNEPIHLRASAKTFDAVWLAALRQERDPARIVELVTEFDRDAGVPPSSEFLAAFGERLTFAIEGVFRREPNVSALGLLAVRRLGLQPPQADLRGLSEGFYQPEQFLATAGTMFAKDVGPFMNLLGEQDPARTGALLLSLLDRMPLAVLNEALGFLLGHGKEPECVEKLKAWVVSRTANHAVLYWFCMHLDFLASKAIAGLYEFAGQVVDSLAPACSGDALKAQNQIRTLFEERKWLDDVLAALQPRERAGLLARIRQSSGWEESAKRSVMARIIRLYPEVQAAAADGAGAAEAAKPLRLTSWRSYRERQEQFKKLVEQTIPENSREIAQARSYGDLRENFEYQAAKERQKLLLRRRDELDADLAGVRGADFEGAPTERAGAGTCVTVQRPGGAVERYWILGEWDRDETLGIISSGSEVSRLLEGRRAGDEVQLPSAQGVELCRIAGIEGLNEELRRWIAGQK
jgi:transcription elongation GreA/GreB family factor